MTTLQDGPPTRAEARGLALEAIWLTPGEYAEILQVEIATVEHWHKTGIGPAPVGRGRRRRYDLADVQAHLAQQRAASAEKPA